MSQMSTILQGLISRTEEGKLKWRTSIRKNVFLTAVDTTAVSIRKLDEFLELYRLEILNKEGFKTVTLETYDERDLGHQSSLATPQQAKDLQCLYELARRSALDPDSTLDKLASDLERIQ